MKIGNEQVFASRSTMKMNNIKSMKNKNFKNYSDKQLKSVSNDFASLFVNELYKSMRQTIGKDKWLHGGLKQDVFEDMLYNEYSKMTAHSGATGIGNMVYQSLKMTNKSIRP